MATHASEKREEEGLMRTIPFVIRFAGSGALAATTVMTAMPALA